jgi:phosphoglycolate phosphatase
MFNLLWDLDGTVVDSMPVIAKSLNETCLTYGKPALPFENLRPFIGPELGDSLAFLLDLEEQEDIQEAKRIYRSFYARDMLTSPIFEGLQAALDHFHDHGIKQYIATSKHQGYAQQIIEALGLNSRFIEVYGSQADGHLGNKKDLLSHILTEEALSAAQTVMIGDTRFDIEAGRHHNLSTVGVLWGYGGKEALEEAGAHFLASNPQDMLGIIRQLSECGC